MSIGFQQSDIAVITGYSEQKRLLTERAKENGWSGVKQIMTIDSSQGDEYQIVFVNLVTTRNQAGFMSTRYRACVGTSRQMEALYFVGNADYWFTRIEAGFKYMHDILKKILDRLATVQDKMREPLEHDHDEYKEKCNAFDHCWQATQDHYIQRHARGILATAATTTPPILRS